MAAFYWLHPVSCLLIKALLFSVKALPFDWWCAVLSKLCLEVRKIPILPPSVEYVCLSINLGSGSPPSGLAVKSSGSDFLQALGNVLPLSFVHLPLNSFVRSGAGFLGTGEISEAFKVTSSNLTCQCSCPFPV